MPPPVAHQVATTARHGAASANATVPPRCTRVLASRRARGAPAAPCPIPWRGRRCHGPLGCATTCLPCHGRRQRRAVHRGARRRGRGAHLRRRLRPVCRRGGARSAAAKGPRLGMGMRAAGHAPQRRRRCDPLRRAARRRAKEWKMAPAHTRKSFVADARARACAPHSCSCRPAAPLERLQVLAGQGCGRGARRAGRGWAQRGWAQRASAPLMAVAAAAAGVARGSRLWRRARRVTSVGGMVASCRRRARCASRGRTHEAAGPPWRGIWALCLRHGGRCGARALPHGCARGGRGGYGVWHRGSGCAEAGRMVERRWEEEGSARQLSLERQRCRRPKCVRA